MRPQADFLLDTIAALATPPGRSALAVVRLSGPDTRAILARVAPGLTAGVEPRRATVVRVLDETGEPLDTAVVTYFAAPASYTGEDAAEISVHGSPVVVERLLGAISRAGVRAARPGEFTERAFRNGKVDLPRAEAVRDLIESLTPAAARASLRRLDGALSRRLDEARRGLLEVAAAIAATIDFAEDAGAELSPTSRELLHETAAELSRLAATHRAGRLLAAGCRVAILGAPNAGKSTLFNALVGSARAIVTEIPGTTRDALEAAVEVGGVPMTLVDTAGLRESDDPVERIGVARALEEAQRADAILYVRDASRPGAAEDPRAREELRDKPVLLVANKIDRAPRSRPSDSVALALCGLSPEAGPMLRALLEREVAAGVGSESGSELVASARQRDAIDRAAAGASGAEAALDRGDSPEYAVVHVHAALDALGDFFGETTTEDVLDRVFSSFCIGK